MTQLGYALDEVVRFLERYVVFSSPHVARTIALWLAAGRKAFEFDPFPLLMLLSPDKRCGKTRTQEAAALLCEPHIRAANISPASLFRIIDSYSRKNESLFVFLDEIDTFLKPNGFQTERGQELTGLINSSHSQDVYVYRVEGRSHKIRKFSVHGPKFLAGIGAPEDFADTITDRAIVARSKRKTPDEKVEPFRRRRAAAEAVGIRDALESALMEYEFPEDFRFDLPGLEDRQLDNWEPLAAIAEEAGGSWPKWVREAAEHITADRAVESDSFGVRLLADCRSVIDGRDRISSEELLRNLRSLPESSWSEVGLGPALLARRLRPYGPRPRDVRFPDGSKRRGYFTADFDDPWRRYLKPLPTATQEAVLILREELGGEVVE